jgi:hypothetical protein
MQGLRRPERAPGGPRGQFREATEGRSGWFFRLIYSYFHGYFIFSLIVALKSHFERFPYSLFLNYLIRSAHAR